MTTNGVCRQEDNGRTRGSLQHESFLFKSRKKASLIQWKGQCKYFVNTKNVVVLNRAVKEGRIFYGTNCMLEGVKDELPGYINPSPVLNSVFLLRHIPIPPHPTPPQHTLTGIRTGKHVSIQQITKHLSIWGGQTRVQSGLFITAGWEIGNLMRISGNATENQDICRLVLVPKHPGEAVTHSFWPGYLHL